MHPVTQSLFPFPPVYETLMTLNMTSSTRGKPVVAFLGSEVCVPLVSLRSYQCAGDLRMNGAVRTAAFSCDS